ncbi:MAG: hypothetical protein E6398_32000, partial [Pseudomonas aeruginosa]|nr:hypothetical protein [Pseudomonas aeruginosa]
MSVIATCVSGCARILEFYRCQRTGSVCAVEWRLGRNAAEGRDTAIPGLDSKARKSSNPALPRVSGLVEAGAAIGQDFLT